MRDVDRSCTVCTVKVEIEDFLIIDCRRDWYVPHHPIFHPHKPGKIGRVLKGPEKFYGASLENALLTGPDLLQHLIYVFICLQQN